MIEIALDDVIRETERTYTIRTEDGDFLFLKSECQKSDGGNLFVPDLSDIPGAEPRGEPLSYSKKISPAEIVRQKADNWTLQQIARRWDIPVSMVRNVLLTYTGEIKKAEYRWNALAKRGKTNPKL